MRRLALVSLLAAGSCVVARPEPNISNLVVRSLPNGLDVDVPNLGHWGKVSATLGGRPPLDAASGSSVLRFADVTPGDHELAITFGGTDGTRARTVSSQVTYEPPLAFGTIPPRHFGFADEDLEPRVPVLLAVPAWADGHAHAHSELVLAGRLALEATVGPTQTVNGESDLSRIENDGVLIDKARAGAPTPPGQLADNQTPRARVVFLLDLRLPGGSGLPCQLGLSAFAVGTPIGGLWNRRHLLHQEFVPLGAYELSETRNQSDLLIRAVLHALRTSLRAPILRRALERACPQATADPRSEHDDLLFPPLLDRVPAVAPDAASEAAPSTAAPPDATPADATSTTEVPATREEATTSGDRSLETSAEGTVGKQIRGRP